MTKTLSLTLIYIQNTDDRERRQSNRVYAGLVFPAHSYTAVLPSAIIKAEVETARSSRHFPQCPQTKNRTLFVSSFPFRDFFYNRTAFKHSQFFCGYGNRAAQSQNWIFLLFCRTLRLLNCIDEFRCQAWTTSFKVTSCVPLGRLMFVWKSRVCIHNQARFQIGGTAAVTAAKIGKL